MSKQQTESIQFLDNLGSGVEGHAGTSARPVDDNPKGVPAQASGNQAPPSHPFNDTLTTAERMRQFGDGDQMSHLQTQVARDQQEQVVTDLSGGIRGLQATLPVMGIPTTDAGDLDCKPSSVSAQQLHDTLASAISDQLVDFDIEGHGQAVCWDHQDREIRLEFRYWAPEEGQDTLDITGAEYGPTDGWAKIELTKEQEQAAEAALLPMYVKWLDARTEE